MSSTLKTPASTELVAGSNVGWLLDTSKFKAESLSERPCDGSGAAPITLSNAKLFVAHIQGRKGQLRLTFDTAHSAQSANIFQAT